MSYRGDLRLGDTLDLKFATVSTAGVPTTLAGSPVISAYVANSTTELTAGITLTVDFDSRTGMHHVRVVASNGNGYTTASDYDLVITTGTVGGVSVVGMIIGSFSIEHRSALMPATAARTLVVDAAGLADANAVKIGPTGSGTAQTARDLGASVLLAAAQKVDVDTIKTNPVVNGGTITFPTNATLASTTGPVASVTGAVGSLTTNSDKTGYALTNAGIDAVLDRTAGVETSFTLRQALRLILASTVAKLSGAAGTTIAIRDINDTKDRITATVDANGNRSAVTTDVT